MRAEAVDVFSDIGADVAGVKVGERGEGGEGTLISRFKIGGSIEEQDAPALENAETAAAAAEGFAADGQADLIREGEEFVETRLEVHLDALSLKP